MFDFFLVMFLIDLQIKKFLTLSEGLSHLVHQYLWKYALVCRVLCFNRTSVSHEKDTKVMRNLSSRFRNQQLCVEECSQHVRSPLEAGSHSFSDFVFNSCS